MFHKVIFADNFVSKQKLGKDIFVMFKLSVAGFCLGFCFFVLLWYLMLSH